MKKPKRVVLGEGILIRDISGYEVSVAGKYQRERLFTEGINGKRIRLVAEVLEP